MQKSAFGGRLSGIFCITLAQFSATIKQIYSKQSAIWQNQIFVLTLDAH